MIQRAISRLRLLGGLQVLRLTTLHMLISGFLAPALGGSVWLFFGSDWSVIDGAFARFTMRLGGSLIGGCLSIFFIFPFTIALGFLSYGVCLSLVALGVMERLVWIIGATVIGAALGVLAFYQEGGGTSCFMGFSGAFIGGGTGALLQWLWVREMREFEKHYADSIGSETIQSAGALESR